MSADFLGTAGRIVFLVLEAAILVLHWVALPANWILLGLALVYGLVTGWAELGWWAFGLLVGLAVLGEILETTVGLGYAARKGATRRGLLGAFVGGLAGALLAASVVPPLGAILGALAGAFLGATLFEYWALRQVDAAVQAGTAALIGKVLAASAKSLCGLAMWCVLAYCLLR